MDIISATGRRKSAIARVYLNPKGKGKITINKKDYKEYFPQIHLVGKVTTPLELVQAKSKYNININVKGGGIKGQVEAIQLGIARALVQLNTDNRLVLKPEGILTRDARIVERKKYGLMKARKQTQYRKR